MGILEAPIDVISWMLLRFLSFLFICCRRMKYFCAWLATCVGVRLITKLRDIDLQSPFLRASGVACLGAAVICCTTLRQDVFGEDKRVSERLATH